MVSGGGVVILWIVFNLSSVVYEILPGFFVSSLVIILVNKYSEVLGKMTDEPKQSAIFAEFEKMKKRSDDGK